MKLYATTTSERASKGQGGNEYLKIDIKDENQEAIAEIYLQRATDTLGDIIYYRTWFAERLYPWNEKKSLANTSNEELLKEFEEWKKGKSQKGGVKYCGKCNAEIKTSLEHYHCSNCGFNN